MADKVILAVGQLAIDGRVIENPTTFEITLEKEEFNLPNLGTSGGGDYAAKKRIKTIGFTATVHDFGASTLARFLSGDASSVPVAVVAEELMTARVDKLVPTDKVIDIAIDPVITQGAATRADSTAYAVDDWIFEGTHLYKATVAGTSAATPPTFQTNGTDTTDGGVTWSDEGVFSAVLDTDFEVSAAGIRFKALGIPEGAPVKVAYTSIETGVVEIGTGIKKAVEVVFDGINDNDELPVVGRFYKVEVDNDGGVPLISEGFAGATMTGNMLIDSSKPISKSRFGTLSVGGVALL